MTRFKNTFRRKKKLVIREILSKVVSFFSPIFFSFFPLFLFFLRPTTFLLLHFVFHPLVALFSLFWRLIQASSSHLITGAVYRFDGKMKHYEYKEREKKLGRKKSAKERWHFHPLVVFLAIDYSHT